MKNKFFANRHFGHFGFDIKALAQVSRYVSEMDYYYVLLYVNYNARIEYGLYVVLRNCGLVLLISRLYSESVVKCIALVVKQNIISNIDSDE